MKIELVSEDDIDIFINKFHFENVNIKEKESLLSKIKDLLIKIDTRYKLDLNGFYKIKVYPNQELGIFLNLIKIDDNEFSKEADFRIIIYQDEDFYLETEEYDILPKNKKKLYYEGKFYMDIKEISDLNQRLDMGKIVYGEELNKIIREAKEIK